MKLKETLILTVPILVLFLIVPSSGNVDPDRINFPHQEISYGHSWGGDGESGDESMEMAQPYFSRTPFFFIDIVRFIMSARNNVAVGSDYRHDSQPAETMRPDNQIRKTKPSTIKRTIR